MLVLKINVVYEKGSILVAETRLSYPGTWNRGCGREAKSLLNPVRAIFAAGAFDDEAIRKMSRQNMLLSWALVVVAFARLLCRRHRVPYCMTETLW